MPWLTTQGGICNQQMWKAAGDAGQAESLCQKSKPIDCASWWLWTGLRSLRDVRAEAVTCELSDKGNVVEGDRGGL
jgi:hypothetical protein